MKHGYTAFKNGVCRCDICRGSWAKYVRERRWEKEGIKPCATCKSAKTELRIKQLKSSLGAMTRRAIAAEEDLIATEQGVARFQQVTA